MTEEKNAKAGSSQPENTDAALDSGVSEEPGQSNTGSEQIAASAEESSKATGKKTKSSKKSKSAAVGSQGSKGSPNSKGAKGYALIRAAGHQFTVSEGDVIRASFAGSARTSISENEEIRVEEVLLTRSPEGSIVAGAPFVKGASVTLRVLAAEKEPKVVIFKMKRRKGYRRKNGHRQPVLAARVESIAYPS